MRHVDDADAFGLQTRDDSVQLVYFAATERSGRFIHDDELRIHGERLGNLYHLLFSHTELANHRPWRNGQTEVVQDMLGITKHQLPVNKPMS
ncbi:hypothetical protein D9M71_729230 [compost metagenome]